MTTTLLTNMPQGCGCAACQAASKESLASDYTGAATASLSEANSLYSGYRWGSGTSGITLTYKFFTALPNYYSSSDEESANFQSFNTQMVNAVGRILDQIENFTNINFVETAGSTSQLGFAQASLPTGVGAWAYYPSTHALGGDVWTNNNYSVTQTPAEGNYGFYTLMHEIGHALGLQHTFTAGLTGDEASSRYSVMAYDWSPFFSSSYMVYDIAALQKIYGANTSYNTGDNIYATNSSLAYTIWDAAGNDTLDASAQKNSVTLDLREGEYSTVGLTRNIGIAYGAVIENATGGAGNDILIGNDANNILIGNAGNDGFVASKGIDILDGGTGIDFLVFDGAISNFMMSLVNNTTLAIQDLTGLYGTTTASNFERFEFSGVSYDFSYLSSSISAKNTPENLTQVTLSVYSRFFEDGVLNKIWTGVNSSLETVESYQGTDFRSKNNGDVLIIDRNNNSGHDTLIVSSIAGYEEYAQTVKITNLQTIDTLTFNNIDHVQIVDTATANDMTLNVLGGYRVLVTSGHGDDTIDIVSSVTTPNKGIYEIFAGEGNDIISLRGGADKMYVSISGGNGDDTIDIKTNAGGTLDGGDGNDVLYGGYGPDLLIGGTGADIFVFDHISTTERDNIQDFNAAQDIIDLSAILSGYDPLTDAINDFVMSSYNANTKTTSLLVDTDGADGAAGFVEIAQVNGLYDQNLQSLIDTNHLVVA